MKAIILARVSTKEQEDGHSIAAQRQRLEDYCQRKGLDVIRVFEIVESSTRGVRKDFEAMLTFAAQQKESIAIVADAVDRFQRSFKESVAADDLIRRGSVELHFCRENIVIGKNASSSDALRWDFAVMGAKSYVLNLSENVKRSLEYKVRNGEWCGPAPLGYLNTRDQFGKSILIPDPERSFLVRRIFELYATGTCSIQGDLPRLAKEWGLCNKTRKGGPLSGSQIHHILCNPFYYGEMRINGKLHAHKYMPLIERALFNRCQDVRTGKSRQTATRVTKRPYVFRGMLRCAVSGRVVTCDTKKGVHTYLICRDPENPDKKLFVRELDVIKQVKAAMARIQIPEALLDELLAHMKANHAAENQFHIDTIAGLRREADQNRERLSTLLDLVLDKSITRDEYDIKARALKEREAEIATQISQHQSGDQDFRTTLECLIGIASQAAELFARSKIEQKRQLMGFMFSNLRLRGKKLEYTMRSPFDLMVALPDRSKWLPGQDSNLRPID